MALHKSRHELIVRLEARIVFDLRFQAVDLADMPNRMLLASSSTFPQRDLDEGTAKQDRGQRVFAPKG